MPCFASAARPCARHKAEHTGSSCSALCGLQLRGVPDISRPLGAGRRLRRCAAGTHRSGRAASAAPTRLLREGPSPAAMLLRVHRWWNAAMLASVCLGIHGPIDRPNQCERLPQWRQAAQQTHGSSSAACETRACCCMCRWQPTGLGGPEYLLPFRGCTEHVPTPTSAPKR